MREAVRTLFWAKQIAQQSRVLTSQNIRTWCAVTLQVGSGAYTPGVLQVCRTPSQTDNFDVTSLVLGHVIKEKSQKNLSR